MELQSEDVPLIVDLRCIRVNLPYLTQEEKSLTACVCVCVSVSWVTEVVWAAESLTEGLVTDESGQSVTGLGGAEAAHIHNAWS